MKKIILVLALVLIATVSNAQKSILQIVKINNMSIADFKAAHPQLTKGESLVLTVKYANIIKDGREVQIKSRILNDYTPLAGMPVTKAVTTDANPQTAEITVKVPSESISVARIQVLANGNKPDDSEGTIFGYAGPFEIK